MLKKEREMREKILNRIEKLLQAGSKLNEAEKKKLIETCKTPVEYEREIRKLARRLKI